jgi:hypothetical protein
MPYLQWNAKVSSHIHKMPPLTLFCNTLQNARFNDDGFLASRPTPNNKDHPLFSVRRLSFKIFAATFHICKLSTPFTAPSPLDTKDFRKRCKLKTQRNTRLLGNTKLCLMPDMFWSCRAIINESNIFQRKASKVYSACCDVTFQLRNPSAIFHSKYTQNYNVYCVYCILFIVMQVSDAKIVIILNNGMISK